mmetsp:Transcript_23097/g.44885  ORF Transcript_23097/g.44885 Transcript_23097/m.44885 type:complete len:215 (+) Transcript_23097:328-972(+)
MAPTVASAFASLSSKQRRASTAAFLTCQTRSVKHGCKRANVSLSPVGAHWPNTSTAVLRTSGWTSCNFAVIAGRICISTTSSGGVFVFIRGVNGCIAPLLINMLLPPWCVGMRPRRAKTSKASNAVRLTSGFQSSRQACNGAKACCLSPLSASRPNTSSATVWTSAWESRIMPHTAAKVFGLPFSATWPYDTKAAFLTDQSSSFKRSLTKSMYV